MTKQWNTSGEVTSVICGRSTISVLWGSMAYCVKLGGEALSCYSKKNWISLRNCSYYHYLTRKVMIQ